MDWDIPAPRANSVTVCRSLRATSKSAVNRGSELEKWL